MLRRKIFRDSIFYSICMLAMVVVRRVRAFDENIMANETDSMPVVIMDSGVEEVKKYDTVIIFYIEVETIVSYAVNISIVPGICCLIVDVNDVDCGQIIVLRPEVILELDDYNPAQEARFLFRNKYASHRRGNCTFQLLPLDNLSANWSLTHTVTFDTYPEEHDKTIPVCKGIDLDPDRSCVPVDCAIKYSGYRNFFRNSTKRCEKVVDCDTRGPDGISVIAYYDWDVNECVPLSEEVANVNEIGDGPQIQLESLGRKYTPDIEASRLEELIDSGNYKLKCNHGFQRGAVCECHNGWTSSGIHDSSLLEFLWCDTPVTVFKDFSMGPRRLTKAGEIISIICLICLEIALLFIWLILAYKLSKRITPNCLLPKIFFKSRSVNYGRLDEVVPHSLK